MPAVGGPKIWASIQPVLIVVIASIGLIKNVQPVLVGVIVSRKSTKEVWPVLVKVIAVGVLIADGEI